MPYNTEKHDWERMFGNVSDSWVLTMEIHVHQAFRKTLGKQCWDARWIATWLNGWEAFSWLYMHSHLTALHRVHTPPCQPRKGGGLTTLFIHYTTPFITILRPMNFTTIVITNITFHLSNTNLFKMQFLSLNHY